MDPSNVLSQDSLRQISPEKLQFLLEMAQKSRGGSPQDMLGALMAASSAAQKSGVSFDPGESSLIIEALKQNMSEADRKKADMILGMMKNRRKG